MSKLKKDPLFKKLFKYSENKEKTNLECSNCEYGYDGTFSRKLYVEDVFLHKGKIHIIVNCEGCGYSKLIICNIEENIDLYEKKRYNIWNYLFKREKVKEWLKEND
jgi:hypothetical protein